MRDIFIIHSLKLEKEALELEKQLGVTCYIPGRDTPQTDGDGIFPANLKALKKAKTVFVI